MCSKTCGGWADSAIAAHPDSPRPDAAVERVGRAGRWPRVDQRRQRAGATSRPPALARALFGYSVRAPGAMASLLDRPDDLLTRWDEMGATRSVPALAAADAHARLGADDPDPSSLHVPLPGYETAFRAFSNHVVLDRALTGNGAADALAVLACDPTGTDVHRDRCDGHAGWARLQGRERRPNRRRRWASVVNREEAVDACGRESAARRERRFALLQERSGGAGDSARPSCRSRCRERGLSCRSVHARRARNPASSVAALQSDLCRTAARACAPSAIAGAALAHSRRARRGGHRDRARPTSSELVDAPMAGCRASAGWPVSRPSAGASRCRLARRPDSSRRSGCR